MIHLLLCVIAAVQQPTSFDKLDANAVDEEDRKLLNLGELVGYVRSNNRAVASLAISSDGALLATSGWDNVVHLHKLGGKEPTSWAKVEGSPSGIAFSPDRKYLATGCKETNVILWNLSGAEPKLDNQLGGHKQRPFAVAFNPKGNLLASGCFDPVLRLWKFDDGTVQSWGVLANEKTTARGLSSLAFSHDGKFLVAGNHIGKETLRIWDASGAFLDERIAPPVKARLVACSPTAPLFAFAGDDGDVHIWKLGPKIEKIRTISAHQGKALTIIKALAFSSDGKSLVTAGIDKHVRLWDVNSGAKRHDWPLQVEARALAFAPDGRHLALGNSDGTVYVLRLESAKTK